MAQTRYIQRTNAYKVGFCDLATQLKAAADTCEPIEITVPAIAALPKVYATPGVITDAFDTGDEAVASGTAILVNDMLVVIGRDAFPGDTVTGFNQVRGNHGVYVAVDPADVANIAKGKKAYRIPTATATIGGALTTDDDSGTNIHYGAFFVGAAVTVATATLGSLPVGSWAPIVFSY